VSQFRVMEGYNKEEAMRMAAHHQRLSGRAVETVNGSPECVNCPNPVAKEGETCSAQCWIAWIAQRMAGVLHLAEGDKIPLDMRYQPWYNDEVKREGP